MKGVDPAAYPHAYMITTAGLLWKPLEPVSFWFLYTVDMSLAAMVFEVNDTFDNRRTYYLTPTLAGEVSQMKESNTLCEEYRQRPNAPVSKQERSKNSHVSLFHSRQGGCNLMVSDPLEALSQDRDPVDITVSLESLEGNKTNHLVSDGQPVEPSTMTIMQKLHFLLSWWWVRLVAFLTIIREAVVVWSPRNLHVWSRPVLQNIGLGRNPTSAGRTAEVTFRMYLRSLLEQCQAPIALSYIPSGAVDLGKELMISPSAKTQQDDSVEKIEFEVLTPAFYTRFVFYAHDLEAFFSELRESCTVSVSRADLLPKLLFRRPPAALETRSLVDYFYFEAIRYLRRRPERILPPSQQPPKPSTSTMALDIREFRISPMDAFMLRQDDAKLRKRYRSLVLRLFVAERFASGSLLLLDAILLILQTWLAWSVLSAWEGKTRILALAAVVWAYGSG